MAQAARRTVAWMPAALWAGLCRDAGGGPVAAARRLRRALGRGLPSWPTAPPIVRRSNPPERCRTAVTTSFSTHRCGGSSSRVPPAPRLPGAGAACPGAAAGTSARPAAQAGHPAGRLEQAGRTLSGRPPGRSNTDYSIYDPTEKSIRVKSWETCFDKQGGPQHTLALDNGAACKGAVESGFSGRPAALQGSRRPAVRGSECHLRAPYRLRPCRRHQRRLHLDAARDRRPRQCHLSPPAVPRVMPPGVPDGE